MEEIRLLKAEEIEVRVGHIFLNGITLLLYKNARVDMNILDSTFGPMRWRRRHIKMDDAMFCEVSIQNAETGEWVSKTDLGAPSFSEPLKGAASDAFKRACVNWGIGRELYSLPFIWVPIDKVEMKDENGRKKVKDSFQVQSITYDEKNRVITGLVIVNQKNQVVYQYMDYEMREGEGKITRNQEQALLSEIKRTGISLPSVLHKHNLARLSDMSPQLWQQAMAVMRGIPDKAA